MPRLAQRVASVVWCRPACGADPAARLRQRASGGCRHRQAGQARGELGPHPQVPKLDPPSSAVSRCSTLPPGWSRGAGRARPRWRPSPSNSARRAVPSTIASSPGTCCWPGSGSAPPAVPRRLSPRRSTAPNWPRRPSQAALHIPRWSRSHLEEATLLLLYRRQDLAARWPADLGAETSSLSDDITTALRRFTKRRYGRVTSRHLQTVAFALVDVPYAASRRSAAPRGTHWRRWAWCGGSRWPGLMRQAAVAAGGAGW
jgi:hypothetical protein